MKIRLRVLGGKIGPDAETDIGASCYLLSITVGGKTYTYLIDCGMETSDDDWVSWRPPVELHRLNGFPEIDDVLVTHAHRDHVGALCLDEVVSRLKRNARVITTRTTAAFLPHVFTDQRKISRRRGEVLPYNMMDIEEMRKRIFPVAKPCVVELVPGEISVLVWPSGHIRGACSFIFMIKEGQRMVKIMFSGDYAAHHQLTTAAAPLPPREWFPDVIASFDCTNGAEPLNPWEHEIERMVDDHRATVELGVHAFTFAFSMDRSQTFADRLASCGIPTWIDGPSAINYGKIMLSPEGLWCEADRPLNLDNVLVAENVGEPLKVGKPAAIVAPSGMGHGPAVRYLKKLLPQENALVAASGYVAPGTNGWRVVHTKRGETVMLEDGDGEFVEVPVNARCEQYRATAHSHREHATQRLGELLKTSCFPEPAVVLAHGSQQAYNWFESSLIGLKTYRVDRQDDRDIILAD